MRARAFEQLDEPVNAELRITADEQMYVIGHDLHLDQLLPPPLELLDQDKLQPFIYRWCQHLAPRDERLKTTW